MLSDEDARFLNRCLSEVPSHGRVTEYRFCEPEVDEFLRQAGVDAADLSSGWRAFFTTASQQICASCKASVAECSCTAPDHVDTVYFLDPNYVFSEWVDRIADYNWFSGITTESIDDLNKRVVAESDSVGTIVFRVFFDGQQFEQYSPDPLKPRVSVGFVNGTYAADEEYVFFWMELVESGFWQGFHSQLVQLHNPISLRLCRKNTDAVHIGAEEIEDELQAYFADQDWEVSEQPQLACPGIDEYIDIEDVNFVASADAETHAVLCECDSNPDHWHFHYYTESELADVTNASVITDARKAMRSNATRYNRLSDTRQDLGPFVRFFAIILGVINIGPLVQFIQVLEIDLTTRQTLALLGGTLGLNLILTLGLVYLALIPVYRLRTFDWSIQPNTQSLPGRSH